MQNTTKQNYFVDCTYSDNVGRGRIAAEVKIVAQKELTESREIFQPELSERGQSFIRALVSFRWATYADTPDD